MNDLGFGEGRQRARPGMSNERVRSARACKLNADDGYRRFINSERMSNTVSEYWINCSTAPCKDAGSAPERAS